MTLLKKTYYFILNLGLVGFVLPAYAIANPIKSNTFGELVTAISNVIIAIGIPIAAVFIIYAGFLFVSARGNEEQLNKAKTTFYWAVIGTALLVGAGVIAKVIQTTVQSL